LGGLELQYDRRAHAPFARPAELRSLIVRVRRKMRSASGMASAIIGMLPTTTPPFINVPLVISMSGPSPDDHR
jgi:hypothetical protein